MHVELRVATKQDISELMVTLRELYESRGEGLGANFSDLLEEFVVSDTHLVMLGLVDGSIAGALVGSYRLDIDYECRAGFIDAIVVRQNQRRRGVGRALVSEFAKWAADRGATALQVLNGRREFFEGIGFEQRKAAFHQVCIEDLFEPLLQKDGGQTCR
jgi:N-acetylglutamate synthase-like GNAT family acetyltransferase